MKNFIHNNIKKGRLKHSLFYLMYSINMNIFTLNKLFNNISFVVL